MTKPKKLKAKTSIFHPILSIREKAYNNIIPFGYNAPVERIKNSIIGNMLESYDSRSRISEDTLETLDDLWGTYLSIPEDRRHKIDPSNRLIRNSDGTYLLNNLDPIIDDLASAVGSYHSYLKYPGGERNLMFFRGLENGESDLGMNNQLLGTYTYTRGKDNQGEYVSYRDDWNINPWKNTTNLYGQERKGLNKYLNKVLGNVEDVSMGIGTSVPIRGKVYLSDIYGVPRDNSHWLSEVVVTPDKKADGGPISKWEDLSMKERHLMIRVGVANGLRDILSIKELYNSFAEGGPFKNQYKGGETYEDSDECAYFLNHTLNDLGYMVSGNAWTPRGVDMIYNGFDSIEAPKEYNELDYNNYMNAAADSLFTNFKTRDTLNPDDVYTVNMYYLNSPNKEKAFNEGKLVKGTHTGYLSYDKDDDTWYVTHNIHGTIHKDRFGDLLKKGSTRVTAVMLPRKNSLANRIKTKLGFAEGGYLNKPFSYSPIPQVRY